MDAKLFSAPCVRGISAVEYTFLNSGARKTGMKTATKTGKLCEEDRNEDSDEDRKAVRGGGLDLRALSRGSGRVWALLRQA
jgi:hypothetical protein